MKSFILFCVGFMAGFGVAVFLFWQVFSTLNAGHMALLSGDVKQAEARYRQIVILKPLLSRDPFIQQVWGLLPDYVEKATRLSVYLDEEVTKQRAELMAHDMTSIPGVVSAQLITKEEALKLYQSYNQDDPALLEFATADVFPLSIEVFFDDPDARGLIRDRIEDMNGVNEVVSL